MQTRVVLDPTERPKAEEILKATGIKTFSQLFSLFIVNYGDHLVNALKASPSAAPPPVSYPGASTQAIPKQLPSLQPTKSGQPQPFKPMGGL